MAMISTMRGAAAIVLLAAQAGFAQEAPEVAPPAPLTRETAKLGQIYTQSVSDPWETRCTKTEAEPDPCQLFQLLRDSNGGAVAEMNFFGAVSGQAAAGAAFVAPLETLLETGVVIQVDDGDTKVYPFAFCNSYGCVARIGFTADELNALKAGNAARIAIVPAAAPDVKVGLTLSLKGFTAGFDAIVANAPKP